MEVIKVYNNNIVAVLTDNDQIALVTGRGVGFKNKEKRELIMTDDLQIFTLSEPNKADIQTIIDHVDVDALEISRQIFNKAKESMNYPISDSLLLQLADHISFKIEMLNQDILVPNLLMTEISYFYPKEFSIGKFGVDLINQRYQTQFDDDEATYLAMHILNASLSGGSTDVYKITEFIKGMLGIISQVFDIEIDHSAWYYERLIVHLKFLGQRLLNGKQDKNQSVFGQGFLKIKPKDLAKIHEIANRTNVLTRQLFQKKLTENEQMYLCIHVLRIQQSQN